MRLKWNRTETPVELHSMLETLGEEYPISEECGELSLEFCRVADERALSVGYPSAGVCRIEYGSLAAACRGIGHALSGGSGREDVYFRTSGVLIDVSRAPVMTVEHFKYWLRRLALFGCNIAIACGDFGHILQVLRTIIRKIVFRGELEAAYAAKNLEALRALADRAEAEMIPSISALLATYRRQWLRSFKTYGQEVMQIRMDGLIERYRETARILRKFADGKCAKIEELEDVSPGQGSPEFRYRMIATGGWFI